MNSEPQPIETSCLLAEPRLGSDRKPHTDFISKQGRGRRITLSAGAGALQRVVQFAGALLVIPVLLRALGPTHFGVWGAATSLVWLNGLLDLGMGSALITMAGQALALNNAAEVRRYLTGALVVGSGLAVVALGVGSLIVSMAASDTLTGPYLIAILGLAANIPLSSANSVWMALQKGHISAFWEFLQTIGMLTGLMTLTHLSTDVRLYIAVTYGALLLSNVGSFVHLLLRHRVLRPRVSRQALTAGRRVVAYGAAYWAAGVVGGLTYLLDTVLALQLLGAEAAAHMTIAMRICLGVLGLLMIISQPLWPAFAEAHARGDVAWMQRALVRGAALTIGPALAGAVLLVTEGQSFLHWWLHAEIGIGSGVLWAMAAWILVQTAGRVPYLLLNAVGVVRFQVILCVIATSTAFCLKFMWASRFGVAGILWATVVTAGCISLPALIWRDRSWLRSRWAQAKARTVVGAD